MGFILTGSVPRPIIRNRRGTFAGPEVSLPRMLKPLNLFAETEQFILRARSILALIHSGWFHASRTSLPHAEGLNPRFRLVG